MTNLQAQAPITKIEVSPGSPLTNRFAEVSPASPHYSSPAIELFSPRKGPADWLLFFFGYLLLIECGMVTPIMGSACYLYWPASGLLTAALILAAPKRWIYFILAAFTANLVAFRLWQDFPEGTGALEGVASLLEAIIAAKLLRRYFASPFDFKSVNRVIGFVALAVAVAPACYATLIVVAKFVGSHEEIVFQQWYLRWAGHAMGAVTIGAAVISLATDLTWSKQLKRRAVLFGVAAMVAMLVSNYLGVYPNRRLGLEEIQLPLFVLPIVVASAIFVNRPATIMIAVLASVVAIVASLPVISTNMPIQRQGIVHQTALHAYVFAAIVWPLIVATVIEEKLAISQEYTRQFEYLQQVMQSSSDSITLKDSRGKYLLANESAAKLMLTTADAMIGKHDSDIVSAEVAAQMAQLEQLAKEGRISETVEEHWNDRGQQRVFVVSRSAWPRDGVGEKGLVIIAREVTEIRRQKVALLQSEQRFQALVDSIPTCIFEADKFGQCRYVNAVWTELSGQSQEEARELGWLDAVHEQDRADILRTWRQFSGGEICEFSRELRLRRPDSSVTWVQVHIGALRDEQDNVIGGIGAILDITPRRYAVENLKESEELFRMLANAAPVMIWRTDAEQKCSFLNDRWLDFIGLELAEAEAEGWNKRIHSDDVDRREEIVALAFRQRSSFELDYRVLRRDGEYRWIVDSGVPIINDAGEFCGFIGGCIDITDRHAAQAALEQLNLELEVRVEQRTSALTVATQQVKQEVEVRREILERLEQKQGELAHVSRVTALGEMAAGLAHELKQPLHAIRNYVSGMKMLGRNTDQSSLAAVALAEIDRETHRAAAIIDRIRSFAARSPNSHSSLYLESVVQDSIALLQSEAARRGVRISLAPLTKKGIRVRGDWIQIQQVLVNLIQNGVDAVEAAAGREKVVTLSIRQEGASAIIECRDGGLGIAPEDLAKIFDPFYTRKTTGLGMGLAISRSIIEAHSGKIMVIDTSLNGTTMGFNLPILNDERIASLPANDFLDRPVNAGIMH